MFEMSNLFKRCTVAGGSGI